MTRFIGIEYGRGCLYLARDSECADAPRAVQKMFPNHDWTIVTADAFDADLCARDRFGENFEIQKKIYAATPIGRHILIGGDHSVNFGHFAAIADQMPDTDLCLVYVDAHFDIHSPESAVTQASGAPHGTNVRALLGDGDARWLSIMRRRPALLAKNLFYLGARSYEPAEAEFVRDNNIFVRREFDAGTIAQVRAAIGSRPFVLSFDFDSIDPSLFGDVLVPSGGGISMDLARLTIESFRDAHSIEFVEYAPRGDTASADAVRGLIDLVA